MKIGITGATGFLGRALVKRLVDQPERLKCLRRPTSDNSTLQPFLGQFDWVTGHLDEPDTVAALVRDCDAIIHSALWRPGQGFRGAEGDMIEFARINIWGRCC